MLACLTLSVAILWGETRRQSIQVVMHGAPLTAALILNTALFLASLWHGRRRWRVALCGVIASVFGLYVCTLPTV